MNLITYVCKMRIGIFGIDFSLERGSKWYCKKVDIRLIVFSSLEFSYCKRKKWVVFCCIDFQKCILIAMKTWCGFKNVFLFEEMLPFLETGVFSRYRYLWEKNSVSFSVRLCKHLLKLCAAVQRKFNFFSLEGSLFKF